MKAIQFLGVLIISIFSFQISSAQTAVQSETIKVNGNCSLCKKNIERSALAAGATLANWNKKTKFLQINYDPAVTNSAKIQTAIANTGYDTQDFKATDSAYSNLDDCCQYDRVPLKNKKE